MAINPKTKQLRGELRAACMECNDVAAFDVLVKILKVEPGDKDILEQKKEVGRRLFNKEVAELGGLIDAGDNETLKLAVDKLGSYVDPAYAAKSALYREALSIVQTCRKAEAEVEVLHQFSAMRTAGTVEAKDKKAEEIEAFATNTGIVLSSEQKQELDAIHNALKKKTERTRQLQQLQKLEDKCDALEETLGTLKQTFNLDASNQIESTMRECAGIFSSLTLLTDEEKQNTGKRFQAAGKLNKRIRKQYYKTLRRKILIRTALSFIVLSTSGVLIYLYSTVSKRTYFLEQSLEALDIPYLQEEVNGYTRYLYSAISNDYASVLASCIQLLEERSRQAKLYKETLSNLELLKKNLSPATVKSFAAEFFKLQEIHKNYGSRFKRELDPQWGMKEPEFMELLSGYLKTRVEFFSQISPSAPIEQIIRQYKDFLEEFRGADSNVSAPVKESFKKAISKKYKNYKQLNEAELETALKELNMAEEEGLPVEETLALAVERYRKEMASIRKIREQAKSCRSLEDYQRVLQTNEAGYGTLPEKYPLNIISQLSKQGERARFLAKKEMLRRISPLGESIEPDDLPKLENIFLRKGNENVYLGSLSSDMYSIIKEICALDQKNWPADCSMIVHGSSVCIGMRANLNDKVMLRAMDGQAFSIAVPSGTETTTFNLRSYKKDKLGIQLNRFENGDILPVALLQKIAKSPSKQAPAYVRMYLFQQVITLLRKYRNSAASGIALSPTLQKDMDDMEQLNVHLSAGGWFEKYPLSVENKCKNFLSAVATHDYVAEIRQNISCVKNCNFVYAGYIQEDQKPELYGNADEKNLFVYSVDESNYVRYSSQIHCAPFTPVFILK